MARARGALPDDFPGRAALEAADITTYGAVREAVAAQKLTEIDNIGDATAEKITTALEEADTAAADASDESTPEAAAPAGNTSPTPSDASVPQETVPAGVNDAPAIEPAPTGVAVVCPKCGVGGHVASEEQIGTATCGNPKHADTLLVRESAAVA